MCYVHACRCSCCWLGKNLRVSLPGGPVVVVKRVCLLFYCSLLLLLRREQNTSVVHVDKCMSCYNLKLHHNS